MAVLWVPEVVGLKSGAGLHIRFSNGHEYWVGVPAEGVCGYCGTQNRYGATEVPGLTTQEQAAHRRSQDVKEQRR